LLRVWKERVATSVRRPMARCHIATCDMTRASFLCLIFFFM
jgi:hypothetical protein